MLPQTSPSPTPTNIPNTSSSKDSNLKVVLIIFGVLIFFMCVVCFVIVVMATSAIYSSRSSLKNASTNITPITGNTITRSPSLQPTPNGIQTSESLLNSLCQDVNTGKSIDSYFKKDPPLDDKGRKSIINSLKGCNSYIGKSFTNYSSTLTQKITGKFTFTSGTTQIANITLVYENGDYKISNFQLTTEN